MKIGFYYRNVNGGIKTHVEALTREFEKMGHEVKKIDQNVVGSKMIGKYPGGISYGADFSVRRMKSEMKEFDILHVHHNATFAEFIIPFTVLCTQKKVINTFHIPIGHGINGKIMKYVSALLVMLYSGKSKKFISVSARAAECVEKYCSRKKRTEMVIIPNGVDVNVFKPIHKKRKSQKIVFGFLGRLSKEKNLINLVKAFKKIDDENIILRIGGDGPLCSKLESMANDRIEIVGYVKDLPGFYQGLDVFILPSYLEAQPISLLEAMATGLPVIASDVGDNKLFIDGNGILCGTSVDDIFKAVNRILTEDRKTMGKRSRKLSENHTWENVAKRTIEIYKNSMAS